MNIPGTAFRGYFSDKTAVPYSNAALFVCILPKTFCVSPFFSAFMPKMKFPIDRVVFWCYPSPSKTNRAAGDRKELRAMIVNRFGMMMCMMDMGMMTMPKLRRVSAENLSGI